MKIRIELEVDLGDLSLDEKCNEEKWLWLFNNILNKSNLFLDNEIGDTIGEIKKVINCYEIK
jgi:hypothetical protein